MSTYTCTIQFADDKHTSVTADYTPQKPADGFVKGNEIVFTSSDGDWSVVYTSSPFDDIERSRIVSGRAGESRRFLIHQNKDKVFPFKCVIAVNGQDVGWESAGNDTPIKST